MDFELDFELDFRVGFSSWIFELDFRVGFSSWIFELGFFWRDFFFSDFTQRTLSAVLHIVLRSFQLEEKEDGIPIRAILFNLS